ncbi:MAG: MarR family transcriptional regulator [Saprospirales bacterium]|nr:MAG: MarR family transcriptional regulator [Saprospirales bacterium]
MIKNLNKEQLRFVEKLARNLDSLGLSKISGVIIAYFIFSNRDELEFDELVEQLNVSKASISNNLRTLEKIGFIYRYRKSGQRKSYYQLGALDMKTMMMERMKSIEAFRDIMKKGVELSSDENENTQRFLRGITHFYDWLLQEFPAMLEYYEKPES